MTTVEEQGFIPGDRIERQPTASCDFLRRLIGEHTGLDLPSPCAIFLVQLNSVGDLGVVRAFPAPASAGGLLVEAEVGEGGFHGVIQAAVAGEVAGRNPGGKLPSPIRTAEWIIPQYVDLLMSGAHIDAQRL